MTDPVPVVSALLHNAAGHLLLQQRDANPALYPLHWTLPGGYVEPGETPEQAIRREMDEEMNLHIPLTYWAMRVMPRADFFVAQHLFIGLLDRPAESIDLREGLQVAWFDSKGWRALPVAFGLETVIEDWFVNHE